MRWGGEEMENTERKRERRKGKGVHEGRGGAKGGG
jgi:hypothetical protein